MILKDSCTGRRLGWYLQVEFLSVDFHCSELGFIASFVWVSDDIYLSLTGGVASFPLIWALVSFPVAASHSMLVQLKFL